MLIIMLFCITVMSAITGLKENAAKYSQFYNVGFQITHKVMNVRRGVQAMVKNLTFAVMETDQKKSDEFVKLLQDEMAAAKADAEWLRENFTHDPQQLDTFMTRMEEAVAVQQTIIDTIHTDPQKAQDILLNEYQPMLDTAVGLLIQISEMSDQDAEADYENTLKLQDTLIFTQLALAGCALLITMVLSTYLTRSITRPVRELERSANQIVNGDFNIDITYESKDELGSLAKTFKNMTSILDDVISDAARLLREMANGNFDVRTRAEERYVGSLQSLLLSIRKLNRDLSSTLGQINQSADQVAAGSGQVSNGAQSLSQGATQQAAAVQQLASTIAGISNQVRDTADNALAARNQSSTAGDEVEECNNQMHDMMAAMEEITRTSNEIGKIIKTIEDIAFQTNILALNAAVEASRAGSAGKGFAVVADEVRNLASKSSEASKDTAELIESSIKAVARGTQIANSTAQSLAKVVEEVRMASSTVDMIADAAKEQSGAVDQVTLGVDQISSVVQTNSSTAVESAAASQELSSQAEVLKSLVAKFILRAEYAGGSSSSSYGSPSPANIDLS